MADLRSLRFTLTVEEGIKYGAALVSLCATIGMATYSLQGRLTKIEATQAEDHDKINTLAKHDEELRRFFKLTSPDNGASYTLEPNDPWLSKSKAPSGVRTSNDFPNFNKP